MSESQSHSTMSNTAQVKYHDGNKAPLTMLPGRVTPALLQWEEHATAYFDKVKTANINKVASILTCWKDSKIDNFIKTDSVPSTLLSLCLWPKSANAS